MQQVTWQPGPGPMMDTEGDIRTEIAVPNYCSKWLKHTQKLCTYLQISNQQQLAKAFLNLPSNVICGQHSKFNSSLPSSCAGKKVNKGESVHYCWRSRPAERLSFQRALTKICKSGLLLMNFISDVSNLSKIAAARGLNPWWFHLDGENADFNAGVKTPHIDCWGAQVIARDANKAWKWSRRGVGIGLIRMCGMWRSRQTFVVTGRFIEQQRRWLAQMKGSDQPNPADI